MNKETAEKFIELYGRKLYLFCLYTARSKDTADDLYQQTFLTALEKDEIDNEMNPQSYLVSIASNLWKNQIRKFAWRKRIADIQAVGEDVLSMIADQTYSLEEEVENRMRCKELRRQVLMLPDKYRVVMLMYFMEDMSIHEIATSLSIPEGTVKSRMNHARKKLKEEMQDE